MSTDKPFAYDAVAYPTAIVPLMTPDRIRAAGLLHGWSAPDPATASVLEIGCGDGLNLMGMATVAPNARHVGFDLSTAAIERGRRLAADAGLSNVELEAGDILAWPRAGERFGYIVCHGVYAWVPPPVRAALLELIAARLAPGGVAYVSYDALPAAAAKQQLQREIVRRTAGIADIETRIRAAAAMLAVFARHQQDQSRLAAQLSTLAEAMPTFDAHYFFHDWLAECYAPSSLADFAAAAAPHGLKVAGEAGLLDLVTDDLDDEALALLGPEGNWVARGAAVDFLRGANMFRHTFLVRADAPPPPAARLEGLHFGFEGKREASPEGDGRPRYRSDLGAVFTPLADMQAAVMEALYAVQPGELSYDEIAAIAGPRTEEVLRQICPPGLVAVHAVPPPYTLRPGARPLVAPLARAMCAAGRDTITLRHMKLVPKEPPTALFLQLCDGTRDRAALAAEMSARLGAAIGTAQIDSALADLSRRRVFRA